MPKELRCPSCGRTLRLPETLIGRSVKCPRCSTAFTAVDPDERPGQPSAPEEEAPAESAAVYSAVDELEVCDEEPPGSKAKDEEDGAGRRPRRRSAEEESERRPRRCRARLSEAEAAAAVRLPAIGLMIVGALGLCLVVVYLAWSLTHFVQEVIDMKVPRGHGGGRLGYLLFLVWGPVPMAGGLEMLRLGNLKAARAACVAVMLPLNPFCVLGLPLGIWGLIVLSRPEVKRWFG